MKIATIDIKRRLVLPGAIPGEAYTVREAAPGHYELAEAMRVSWAGTGADAESLLAAEAFDLVLLDFGLPDTSGFDLCRAWRARQLALPVLFLTARDSEIDRVVGLEIGGDDYLVKPFSLRELVTRIRAILRLSLAPLTGGGPANVHPPAAGMPNGAR